MFVPILLDLPVPIVTQRLRIRPCQPGDGTMVNAAIKESHDVFKKYLPWARNLPSVNDTEITMRTFYAQFVARESCHMVILDHADNHIGMCGFQKIRWGVPSAEIGYWIRTSCTGKGYITEAIQALVEFGFEHLRLNRVAITCREDNKRSQAVAERCGFSLEAKGSGIIDEEDGVPHPSRYYVRMK